MQQMSSLWDTLACKCKEIRTNSLGIFKSNRGNKAQLLADFSNKKNKFEMTLNQVVLSTD